MATAGERASRPPALEQNIIEQIVASGAAARGEEEPDGALDRWQGGDGQRAVVSEQMEIKLTITP